MIVLGIETATSVCSVGIVDGDRVAAYRTEDAGRRHSIVLIDAIDRVLHEAGIDQDDLAGVAVSAGPGSFTGLRIGMGLAKGICLGRGCRFSAVSTLEALVLAAEADAASVCACLDARHGQLYSGVYARAAAGFFAVHEDEGRTVTDLLDLLDPDTAVVGFGIGAYADAIREAGHRVLPDVVPSGAAVARLGAARLEAGAETAIDRAEPNYCRKSQAEREREGDLSRTEKGKGGG